MLSFYLLIPQALPLELSLSYPAAFLQAPSMLLLVGLSSLSGQSHTDLLPL